MRKTIQATLVLIALTHGLAAHAGESYQSSMAGSEAVPLANETYGNAYNNSNNNNQNRLGPDNWSGQVAMKKTANGTLTDVDALKSHGVPGSYETHEVKMEVRTYR